MSSDELSAAITNAQETLSKVDQFIHGQFVSFVLGIVNKYTAEQLDPIFQLVHALDNQIAVEDLKKCFSVFQADLNNARQINLTNISNAGQWLKNHPLILRFVATHFTEGTVDEQAVQQMRDAVRSIESVQPNVS